MRNVIALIIFLVCTLPAAADCTLSGTTSGSITSAGAMSGTVSGTISGDCGAAAAPAKYARVKNSGTTYTLGNSAGIASVARTATGRVTVTFSTPFPNATDYGCLISPYSVGVSVMNNIDASSAQAVLRYIDNTDLDMSFTFECK